MNYDSLIILASGLLTSVVGYFGGNATDFYRSGGYYRVGLGGEYMSHSSNSMDFSAPMGTISIEARGIMRERVQTGLRGYFGYGNITPKNTQILESGNSLYYDFKVWAGYNLLSQENPLYLNLVFNSNSFIGADKNKGINGLNHRVGWDLYALGLEIDGRYRLTPSVYLEYALGYSYAFQSQGEIGIIDNLKINNSYAITASLGYSQDINPSLLYFIKANAKYLKLGRFYDSIQTHYPTNSSYSIGLEVGLGF